MVYTYFVSITMYQLIVNACLSFEMIGLEKVYFTTHKEVERTPFFKGKLKTWLIMSNRRAWTSPMSREFDKKGTLWEVLFFSVKTLQKPTYSRILC